MRLIKRASASVCIVEDADRLEDAEAAYAKVLTDGSDDMKAEALHHIEVIARKRDSFWEEHFVPVWKGLLKVLISHRALVGASHPDSLADCKPTGGGATGKGCDCRFFVGRSERVGVMLARHSPRCMSV